MAQNSPESRPEIERERDMPRESEDARNFGDTDADEEDIDPDSAESENDRDDTLTE